MLMTKTSKPSPTSQSCQRHISSPTSVTNIDVAAEVTESIGASSKVKLLSQLNLEPTKNHTSLKFRIGTIQWSKLTSEKILSGSFPSWPPRKSQKRVRFSALPTLNISASQITWVTGYNTQGVNTSSSLFHKWKIFRI